MTKRSERADVLMAAYECAYQVANQRMPEFAISYERGKISFKYAGREIVRHSFDEIERMIGNLMRTRAHQRD